MKRHFEEVEEELKSRLLHMGGLAEEMIELAMRMFHDRTEEPLARLIENEAKVNNLHIEIDDRCLKLIALHQPTANDLRFIMAAIKINTDLERIADQAVNIGENTQILLKQPPLKRKVHDIPRMAEVAKTMVKDSLDAFVNRNVELARDVVKRDDEEDNLKTTAFQDLMELMQSDSATIQRALCLILISRNLERVGDHATNIAEDVIFMVQGKDIRHSGDKPGDEKPVHA